MVMKIRQGFVSNLSSSSFMAVFDKKALDQMAESFQPYIQFFIENYLQKYCDNEIFGQEVYIDFGEYWDDENYTLSEYIYAENTLVLTKGEVEALATKEGQFFVKNGVEVEHHDIMDKLDILRYLHKMLKAKQQDTFLKIK